LFRWFYDITHHNRSDKHPKHKAIVTLHEKTSFPGYFLNCASLVFRLAHAHSLTETARSFWCDV